MATGDSVLRRKASARAVRKAAPPTPERATRLALLRAARKVPGLDAVVENVEDGRHGLTELLDALPSPAFFGLLPGPEEALGLAALSFPGLASVVEARMTGRLAAGDPQIRRPTATDAVLTAEFIDSLIGEIAELPVGAGLRDMAGFRYGSYLDDPRPLDLMMEDRTYRTLRLTLSFGFGLRRAVLLLAIPEMERARLDTVPALPQPMLAADEWSRRLEAQVYGAALRFDVRLARLTLPLGEATSLRPGMVLPLDGASIEAVRLIGSDGRDIAEGRLGQMQGRRALRLSGPPLGAEKA